jgi:two-component system cell cycle sensor histidine kinase/response regulator CckA
VILAIARGEIWSGELAITTRDGRSLRREVTVLPAATDSQPAAVLLADTNPQIGHHDEIDHDRKLRAVGQFAGSIAHSLNNYLTVMRAHIAIARDSERALLESQLEELDQATDRAGGLITQLLLFSRGARTPRTVTDAVPLLLGAVDAVRRVTPESIRVSASISESCGQVKVEQGFVEQIVLTLASNSRDAMPGGGILRIDAAPRILRERIDLTTGALLPGDYLAIEVKDSGTGIDAETMNNLFRPFYTTKPVGVGTGLGMPTVREMVEKHGGQIDIKSEVGAGTTVTVLIPRCRPLVRSGTKKPRYREERRKTA